MQIVTGLNGQLAAAVGAGAPTLSLVNLQGDVMANAATTVSDPGPLATYTYAEFGGAQSGAPDRYGWLGGYQRSSEALGGAVLMGVGVYNPYFSRFDQVDPIVGGSANAYDYCGQSRLTCYDLDGRMPGWLKATIKFAFTGVVTATVYAIIIDFAPEFIPWAKQISTCVAAACAGFLFVGGSFEKRMYAAMGGCVGGWIGASPRTTRLVSAIGQK